MRETANLPKFSKIFEECRALMEDSYVDDILTSHNNPETQEIITKGMQEILEAGGFFLKPWVLSHQSGRTGAPANSSAKMSAPRALVLPNQM